MDNATAKPGIANSNPVMGTNSSYAQSPVICAKAILLTFARTTVALGRAVYRHDRRKISDATLPCQKAPQGGSEAAFGTHAHPKD